VSKRFSFCRSLLAVVFAAQLTGCASSNAVAERRAFAEQANFEQQNQEQLKSMRVVEYADPRRIAAEFQACQRSHTGAASAGKTPEQTADEVLTACFRLMEPTIRSSAMNVAGLATGARPEELKLFAQHAVDQERAKLRAVLVQQLTADAPQAGPN
jgi:hypothetical protein